MTPIPCVRLTAATCARHGTNAEGQPIVLVLVRHRHVRSVYVWNRLRRWFCRGWGC